MNLYILRHGETSYNVDGRFQGQVDVKLNDNGKIQAKKAYEKFKNINIDFIISSPLSRAIDTVRDIANSKGLDIIIDNRIIERSFGKLEGQKSIENYEEKIELYNIESREHLKKRLSTFLEEIIGKYKKKDVLVATHEAVAQIIHSLYGEDKEKNYRLKNGEYTKYIIK